MREAAAAAAAAVAAAKDVAGAVWECSADALRAVKEPPLLLGTAYLLASCDAAEDAEDEGAGREVSEPVGISEAPLPLGLELSGVRARKDALERGVCARGASAVTVGGTALAALPHSPAAESASAALA